jgi:hypothetical protein
VAKPHADAILVRHDERCTECRYNNAVWTWRVGGSWIARCADPKCGAFRDSLDLARYGPDLGLPPESYAGRTSSRFEQSRGQRKTTNAVAGGECVHCVLAQTRHITRRGAVTIPRDWLDVPPTFQASLFNVAEDHDDPPTILLSDVVGAERDHILQRQLHDKIAPGLSSEQAVFVRRHWVVPSCRKHNQQRAFSLEPLPYLMHVFALFLAAKDLSIADSADETQLFVDAVKAAHIVLRLQVVAATKRRA